MVMSIPNFYGVNIDTPLSLAHNTPGWGQSVIGTLTQETEGSVFIEEIPQQYQQGAEYGWRVVDAYWSPEDSTITYFRAFDVYGESLPHAVFGVNWGGAPHRIGGGFKYRPQYGNEYYIPIEAKFTTPNAGGYTAQVLDRNWPSEGLAFGMQKTKKHHSCLVVSFRLFAFGENYPNDLGLVIR
jgi:hypothetical protein